MSLINPTSPAPITPSDAAVNRILKLLSDQFTGLLGNWILGMNLVWKNPDSTPAQVLVSMGQNAAQIFQLSAQTAAFLELLEPGCTAAIAANVKLFTVNADGTITINT